MLPKTGKVFPGPSGAGNEPADYAAIIAAALRAELGDTHRAIKIVMRWTGAAERTVKHWLAGFHGPGGDYLLALMRESDVVLEAVLTAAGREDVLGLSGTTDMDGSGFDEKTEAMPAPDPPHDGAAPASHDGENASLGSSDGTINGSDGTISGTINGTINPPWPSDLNRRQLWFLERLADGVTAGAVHLQRRWGISARSARRDIADLMARGLVVFSGARKNGGYRLADK